ncbi:MAG: hybrid sensor histidine kinase/response regulator [Thermoanaerobaculia bacterium]|jgi:two-component system chemotaxis sensor kinase CheA
MANKNDDFLKKLLVTFRIEAGEHLETMSSGLLALERATVGEQRMEIVEKIFREAHSLKGAARAVNLAEIESVCHSLESVFAGLKSNRVAESPPLFDLVHQVLDALAGLLTPDEQLGKSGKPAVAALIQRLDYASKAAAPGKPPTASGPDQPDPGTGAGRLLPSVSPGSRTIRVHLAKLDSVMRRTEELFAPRLAAGQRVIELRETGAAVAVWKKERVKVQPARRMIERSLARTGKTNGAKRGQAELTKVLEYLDAESQLLKTIEDRLAKLERSAEHDHRSLSGMVDNLLHDVKEMHMLPLSSLLGLFPRLIRELARDQGKQVELVTQGGEIEIDRRILEEMKDALIHLLRNCVDHGIEAPAEREQKGKPPHGTLTIAISHQDSRKVEILVADDGTGIDVGKVKAAAGRLGLVPAEEIDKLDERERLALIFQSGFSTSPIITDISGRGLGLAIVREKVDRLGGTIAMETRPDAGTTVRIVLPLTLATFRAVIVQASDQLFIIPAASVERVTKVPDTDIRTVENRETIPLDGRTVSLVWLSDMLELSRPRGESAHNAKAVVLGLGADRIAFRVDAILGEQEVMVKGLGRQLARVRNVAGASVLGTGQVVPVLNVPDLMRSATKPSATQVTPASETTAEAGKQSILVVEDSITSRTLLKNILEAAGYNVTTAVDGIDAYTTLKTGTFDLIVSDVEMPRMDGFDLTARVRADEQLSGLPVVLVTAMESREHRERGIDAGANAYIVKSSFDQSNLLEVVRRLI